MALLSLFGIALLALTRLHASNAVKPESHKAENEVLYLPNGAALGFISFGYRNALGNLLWFRTISYFGEHYATDRNYHWLSHMCGLVSELSPKAIHVYQFCSNMLSWEANVPEKSVELLTKGIKASPSDWRLYYYRGITYLHFLKQAALAKDDFVTSSHLPDAPVLVKRLAAKTLSELNSPSAARALLQSLIAQESDPSARQFLLDKLRQLDQDGGSR